MSNDSFRKIVDTVVDTSSVANPLKALNVSNSSATIVDLTSSNADLLPNLIKAARDELLVKFPSTTAANRVLTVGPDTAANAKNIQSVLGLYNANDQVLLTFVNVNATLPAFTVSLANTGSTSNNVKINLRGVSNSFTQVLFNAAGPIGTDVTPSGTAYVVVTASSVTSGSESVEFNIKLPVTTF